VQTERLGALDHADGVVRLEALELRRGNRAHDFVPDDPLHVEAEVAQMCETLVLGSAHFELHDDPERLGSLQLVAQFRHRARSSEVLHVQFAMAPTGVPADAGMAVLSNGLDEPPLGLAPVDAPIFFGVVRLETATFVSLAVVSSAVSFPRGEPWQWTRRRR